MDMNCQQIRKNLAQKYLTEVKILEEVSGGLLFLKHPEHLSQLTDKPINKTH